MRRFIISLFCLLISFVIASCSQENVGSFDDDLVSVSFSSSKKTKDMSVSRSFDENDYIWYYTAIKADETGLNHGQVSDCPVAGEILQTGLSGNTIAGLSQGFWTFTLDAYSYSEDNGDKTRTEKIWSGTVSNQRVQKGNSNIVYVSMSPLSEPDTTGAIVLGDITLVTDNQQPYPEETTMTVKVSSVTTNTDVSSQLSSLPVGAYLVTVIFMQTADTSKTAQMSIVVNVFTGQTSTVTGTVDCDW